VVDIWARVILRGNDLGVSPAPPLFLRPLIFLVPTPRPSVDSRSSATAAAPAKDQAPADAGDVSDDDSGPGEGAFGGDSDDGDEAGQGLPIHLSPLLPLLSWPSLSSR